MRYLRRQPSLNADRNERACQAPGTQNPVVGQAAVIEGRRTDPVPSPMPT